MATFLSMRRQQSVPHKNRLLEDVMDQLHLGKKWKEIHRCTSSAPRSASDILSSLDMAAKLMWASDAPRRRQGGSVFRSMHSNAWQCMACQRVPLLRSPSPRPLWQPLAAFGLSWRIVSVCSRSGRPQGQEIRQPDACDACKWLKQLEARHKRQRSASAPRSQKLGAPF